MNKWLYYGSLIFTAMVTIAGGAYTFLALWFILTPIGVTYLTRAWLCVAFMYIIIRLDKRGGILVLD